MSTGTIAALYAAALHICGLAALIVLLAIGTVTWDQVGGIVGYLVGFASGVPVSVAAVNKATTPAS